MRKTSFHYLGIPLLSCAALVCILWLANHPIAVVNFETDVASIYYLLFSLSFPCLVWYILTRKKWFGVSEDASSNDFVTIGVVQIASLLITYVGWVLFIYISFAGQLWPYILIPTLIPLLLMLIPAKVIQRNLKEKSIAYAYASACKIIIFTVALCAIGIGFIQLIKPLSQEFKGRKSTQQNYQPKPKEITQIAESVIDENIITLSNGSVVNTKYLGKTALDVIAPSGKQVAFINQQSSIDPYNKTTIVNPNDPFTLYVYNYDSKEAKALLELPKGKTFFRCTAPVGNKIPCIEQEMAYPLVMDIKWLSDSSLEVWYYDEHLYYDSNKVISTKKVFSL